MSHPRERLRLPTKKDEDSKTYLLLPKYHRTSLLSSFPGDADKMLWHQEDQATGSAWVEEGGPVGQFYGLGGVWTKWKDLPEITKDLGADSPAMTVSYNSSFRIMCFGCVAGKGRLFVPEVYVYDTAESLFRVFFVVVGVVRPSLSLHLLTVPVGKSLRNSDRRRPGVRGRSGKGAGRWGNRAYIVASLGLILRRVGLLFPSRHHRHPIDRATERGVIRGDVVLHGVLRPAKLKGFANGWRLCVCEGCMV